MGEAIHANEEVRHDDTGYRDSKYMGNIIHNLQI